MESELIFIDRTDSTNSYVARNVATLAHGTAVACRCQTAGRGQRGNSWESDAGKNVTMSVLLRPGWLDVSCAFAMSEAVALGVACAVEEITGGAVRPVIKWPNDIYAGDMKIAGILIENALRGTAVHRAIAGIGLNVNQTIFLSDAPNPVSMSMLTGEYYDVVAVARTLRERIMHYMELTATESGRGSLHALFMERLWRGRGEWDFEETATGRRFRASVRSIAPSGHITLAEPSGRRSVYAFKEIVWR